MQKRSYLTYIHALRGLAILMIVAVHTRGYSYNWETDDITLNFLQTLLDNSTFIFVFIGGFLFKYIYVETFKYKNYLIKKFKYVFLPYVIMSVPAIALRILTNYIPDAMSENFLTWPAGLRVIYFFITGTHLVPLWFMPMIFIFFLVSPLIVKLDNRFFYIWCLPILLILDFFTFRPMYNANPLLAFIHFFPVYLFGMWACRHRNFLTGSGWKLGIPMFLIYLAISLFEFFNTNEVNRHMKMEMMIYDGRPYLNVLQVKLAALSLFLLILFYKLRNRNLKFFAIMGTYSFGIYFIHHYYIALTNVLFKKAGISYIFTIWTYLLFTVLVIFFSYITVYLSQIYFKKKSRYIIGS